MLELQMLGSGGMLPLPHRGLSSLLVRIHGKIILIDCGEGTQMSAYQLNQSLYKLDMLLLTHLHADHILGVPGLLATLNNAGRTKPLIVIGPHGTKKAIYTLMSSVLGLQFSLKIIELTDPEMTFTMNEVTITAFPVTHSVKCYGYVLCVKHACVFDTETATEYGIPQKYWGTLQAGMDINFNGKICNRNLLFGEDRPSLKVVYATDTGVCDNLAKYGRNSDLMILDAIAPGNRMSESAKGMHMSFSEAATIAKDAETKKLVLTHFSPAIVDPCSCLDEAREIFPNTVCSFRGYKEVLYFSQPTLLNVGVNEKSFYAIWNGSRSYIITKESDNLTVGSHILLFSAAAKGKVQSCIKAVITDKTALVNNHPTDRIQPSSDIVVSFHVLGQNTLYNRGGRYGV